MRTSTAHGRLLGMVFCGVVLLTTAAELQAAQECPRADRTHVVPRRLLSVVSVDSEHPGYEARNAIDGQVDTLWHTAYGASRPDHPHQLTLDLGKAYQLEGLLYLPRRDGLDGGTVLGYRVYVSTNGTSWGSPVATGTFAADSCKKVVSFSPITGRYLRFESVSAIGGGAFASAAEIELVATTGSAHCPVLDTSGVIPHNQLDIVSADSEQSGYEAARAIDGSPTTFWHTQWIPTEPAHPHQITLDLGSERRLSAVHYLPRQDGSRSGMVGHYQLFISSDGSSWGPPIIDGTFVPDTCEKRIGFSARRGRYVRFVALSETYGNSPTSVAELKVVGESSTGGVALVPYMGWNSWYALGLDVSGTTLRAQADLLVSLGLRDVGYDIVWSDSGWNNEQPLRDPNGYMVADPSIGDVAELAAYMHAKSLKLGLYTGTAAFSCGNAGSWDYYEQDADQFAAWGVDALKVDYCNNCPLWSGEGGRACYTRIRDAYWNNSAGRDLIFNVCQWGLENVVEWGRFTANSWRTGGDIGIGFSWENVLEAINRNDHPDAAGPGRWNDPDYLLIGEKSASATFGLTRTEERAYFSMWAIMNAPLVLATDLRYVSQETLDIIANAEVIAVNQDLLGMQASRVVDDGDLEVWAKHLAGTGQRAVVLLNRGSTTANMTLRWSDIDLADEPAAVRDLWKATDEGSFTATYTTTVPPHGVVMLRIQQGGDSGDSDGGAATPDGGATTLDGGVATSDGGPVRPDGGASAPDAGGEPPSADDPTVGNQGCACQASSSTAPLASSFTFALLWLLTRRRRGRS